MTYKFPVENGFITLINPNVVIDSTGKQGVGFNFLSEKFEMPIILTLSSSMIYNIPYEFSSEILPISYDPADINQWAADRLEEYME